MKVRALLSDRSVASLSVAETVLAAVELMVKSHCGSVLAVDPSGKLRGIFTERDLMVRVVAEGISPTEVTIGEVMTSDIFTCGPDEPVQDIRLQMRERHIRHLPVVEDDRVLAVLSTRDLLRAMFREKRDDAQAMSAYIRGEG